MSPHSVILKAHMMNNMQFASQTMRIWQADDDSGGGGTGLSVLMLNELLSSEPEDAKAATRRYQVVPTTGPGTVTATATITIEWTAAH